MRVFYSSMSLRFARLVVIAALALPAPALAQAYSWQNLSASDAIQAVRNFEGNPALAVTVTTTPPPNPGGPTGGYFYELSAGRYTYTVWQYTADGFGRDDNQYYASQFDMNNAPATIFTLAQCQSIAQAFMQAHFPNASVLGMPGILAISTGGNPGWTMQYRFSYLQNLPSNVLGPCHCSVTVETAGGSVIGYGQRYFPVNVSLTPGLSSDQAAADAIAAIPLSGASVEKVVGLEVIGPDPFGWDRLVWEFYMIGQEPTDSFPEEYQVTVNANTGEVMGADMTMSAAARTHKGKKLPRAQRKKYLRVQWGGKPTQLAHPPVLLKGKPYFWAGYLGKKAPETDVRLSAGERYVPISLASHLLHMPLSYRAKDRTVIVGQTPIG